MLVFIFIIFFFRFKLCPHPPPPGMNPGSVPDGKLIILGTNTTWAGLLLGVVHLPTTTWILSFVLAKKLRYVGMTSIHLITTGSTIHLLSLNYKQE